MSSTKGVTSLLIDRQTFDRVQELLDSRVKAGEKQRIHQHYLKGTIFCRRCQSRLSLTYANGHGGIYPYFFCLGRQRRNGCDLPHLAMDTVEARIEQLYESVELTAEESADLRSELRSQLDVEAEKSVGERKLLERQIAKLDRQRYVWAEKSASGRL